MQKTFFLYMIGISGSGKTTIAEALEKNLKEKGVDRLQVIDGDVIRSQFGDIFGYTFEERMKCNKAVRVVVDYLLRNNVSVILTQVGGYKLMREKMRGQFNSYYNQIYIKCSLEECARRDVKGYYKKIENGEISNLNGANDLFEIPEDSDLIIDTEIDDVETAVGKIISYMGKKEYV